MNDFTDLSRPLPITDPVKLQETMAVVVRILWSKPLAVIAPYTGSVSVPYPVYNNDSESRNNLESQP